MSHLIRCCLLVGLFCTQGLSWAQDPDEQTGRNGCVSWVASVLKARDHRRGRDVSSQTHTGMAQRHPAVR